MKLILLASAILLSGCASKNYIQCLETQKSISRDMVVMEAARVAALVEMSKSTDPAVKATGIMLLQKNDVKSIALNCPN